jgi:hypothetical protein
VVAAAVAVAGSAATTRIVAQFVQMQLLVLV